MELTNKEKDLVLHILDMYSNTLIELTDGKEPTPSVLMCVDELLVIKSVAEKMILYCPHS